MTIHEIRAAFAVIANSAQEAHVREFALEQFHKLKLQAAEEHMELLRKARERRDNGI